MFITEAREIAESHCRSIGKDKKGLTNCKACKESIRNVCHSYKYVGANTFEDIFQRTIDVATAVRESQKKGQRRC